MTETIRKDMVAAMKAKDATRVTTLRGVLSAFTNELVAKGKKPTEQLADTDATAVLKRLAKQRKDSIEQYTAGNRPELAEQEKTELAIIEEYLPEMASRAQIDESIKKHAEGVNPEDKSARGQLIGAVMGDFGGLADGKEVAEAIGDFFSAIADGVSGLS